MTYHIMVWHTNDYFSFHDISRLWRHIIPHKKFSKEVLRYFVRPEF